MSSESNGSDPTEDIKKAVEKLAAFNQFNDPLSTGSLEKTINLMKQFFSFRFGDKEDFKEGQEILKAIDILKKNYLILERLKQGTPQQQKWAVSIEGVIQKYNSIIEQAQRKTPSFTDKIASYIAKQNGHVPIKELAKINFPFHRRVKKDFFEQDCEKKISLKIENPQIAECSKKIAELSQMVVSRVSHQARQFPHLTKQAVELFLMKAIALIEKNGILSTLEARQAVRSSYLQTFLPPDLSTCTAVCTVVPFPGQTIVVNGSFEKSPKTGDYALPNAKSFQLSLTSHQTGFPHPMQHTGNASPDLIPQFPQHLSRLPLLKPLYEEKHKLAQDLLENKKIVERAKLLQRLKKEAFDQDLDDLLQWHAKTAAAFAAHAETPKENIAAVQNFYQCLAEVPNCFRYLSETHHIINENFSIKPLEKLKQEWINKNKSDFHPEKIMAAEVLGILNELDDRHAKAASDLEKNTIRYIKAMGESLAHGSHRVILQHLSEGMGFAPPVLNDFEQKLQLLAFKQLHHFISDMRCGELILDRTFLLEKLILDYTILESNFHQIESRDPDAQIVKELEGYYSVQWQNMQKRSLK